MRKSQESHRQEGSCEALRIAFGALLVGWSLLNIVIEEKADAHRSLIETHTECFGHFRPMQPRRKNTPETQSNQTKRFDDTVRRDG